MTHLHKVVHLMTTLKKTVSHFSLSFLRLFHSFSFPAPFFPPDYEYDNTTNTNVEEEFEDELDFDFEAGEGEEVTSSLASSIAPPPNSKNTKYIVIHPFPLDFLGKVNIKWECEAEKKGKDGCVSGGGSGTSSGDKWEDSNGISFCSECVEYYEISVGMRLEAVDLRTGCVCVASIADFDHECVRSLFILFMIFLALLPSFLFPLCFFPFPYFFLENRIHFDGKPTAFDYWYPLSSTPSILAFPETQAKKGGLLQPPQDYFKKFEWGKYLEDGRLRVIPRGFFLDDHLFDPSIWMSVCKTVSPPSTYKKVSQFPLLFPFSLSLFFFFLNFSL